MTDNENQQEDFQWFMENMEGLYKVHGEKVAVIKNKVILGIYEVFMEALDNTIKTEQLGTFIIQKLYESRDKIPVAVSGYGVYGG